MTFYLTTFNSFGMYLVRHWLTLAAWQLWLICWLPAETTVTWYIYCDIFSKNISKNVKKVKNCFDVSHVSNLFYKVLSPRDTLFFMALFQCWTLPRSFSWMSQHYKTKFDQGLHVECRGCHVLYTEDVNSSWRTNHSKLAFCLNWNSACYSNYIKSIGDIYESESLRSSYRWLKYR